MKRLARKAASSSLVLLAFCCCVASSINVDTSGDQEVQYEVEQGTSEVPEEDAESSQLASEMQPADDVPPGEISPPLQSTASASAVVPAVAPSPIEVEYPAQNDIAAAQPSPQQSDASSHAGIRSLSTDAVRNPMTKLKARRMQEATVEHKNVSMGKPGLTLSSVSLHTHVASLADITSTRPTAGGAADVVTFAIFTKSFYGADVKHNTFTVDSVMSVKWTDPRAIAMIPAGLERVTLSGKQAAKKVWMPAVVVTNRAIKKYEIISTSVFVHKTGVVQKIERALAVCNNVYDLEEYPFDTQKMEVKIASSKYMLDDVALVAEEDRSLSGAKEEIFDSFPYQMKSWKIYAFEETDGALKKSRGVLQLTVKRAGGKYDENHLAPAFLFLIISWSVFWFPFTPPFVTPRLALSILCLLAFTNLMIKSNSALPGGAPLNWNDVFNQQIQSLMFITIVLNIVAEGFSHHFKMEELAKSVNHEAKVLQPVLSISVISIILSGGMYKWISVANTAILTKVLTAIVVVCYVSVAMSRLSGHKAANAKKEAEAARAAFDARQIAMDQTMAAKSSSAGVMAAGAMAAAAADDDGGDGGGGGD